VLRRIFVFLHRWVGLFMAGFLIVVGLTGSILAFYNELDRLVTPQLYAFRRDKPKLDLATLAERAEALLPPTARLVSVRLQAPDQAIATVKPRDSARAHSNEAPLGFDQLFFDPWTGVELGRRMRGDLSQGVINLMPFIYLLHDSLTVHGVGTLALGVIATFWTIDCFVGFYLTLPVSRTGFLRNWRRAWLVKWRAGAFRINFDLHRAGGLWLWLILFVFAWSSVMFNLRPVYESVMHAILKYDSIIDAVMSSPRRVVEKPKLDWRAAQEAGDRIMADEARKQGFAVRWPRGITYAPKVGMYAYVVATDRDIAEQSGATMTMFDGDTGERRAFTGPYGANAGVTVGEWLMALHTGRVFGFPYRIFVMIVGLAVTMLSATGVYIWWKKRLARKLSKKNMRQNGRSKPRWNLMAGHFQGAARTRENGGCRPRLQQGDTASPSQSLVHTNDIATH